MKTYYVYIIECSDKSYYTGVTNNIEKRLSKHKLGIGSSYVTKRLSIKLRWHGAFNDIRHAISFEKKLKGWSRKKKEALFTGNWGEISKLSKSRSNHASRGSA